MRSTRLRIPEGAAVGEAPPYTAALPVGSRPARSRAGRPRLPSVDDWHPLLRGQGCTPESTCTAALAGRGGHRRRSVQLSKDVVNVRRRPRAAPGPVACAPVESALGRAPIVALIGPLLACGSCPDVCPGDDPPSGARGDDDQAQDDYEDADQQEDIADLVDVEAGGLHRRGESQDGAYYYEHHPECCKANA